jgi:KUP system potassium uptake protein
MGHFGARPIRIAWFVLVLPALVLNYFGQGAYLLMHPHTSSNTFYALTPAWGLYPLVVLATLATVIASQAVISGVFSLTMQAAQLGYIPRVRITHTSREQFGQIYVPLMNWLLLVSTVGLVLAFESSSNLAAAYGVAVTLTMVITTLLLLGVMRERWGWTFWLTYGLGGLFLIIDLSFFGANITKIDEGGWFPLAIGAVMFTLATTWKRGRMILAQRVRKQLMSLDSFLASLHRDPPTRVPGTAIFMTGNPNAAPMALVHNLKHNKSLHERAYLLTIVFEEDAHVPASERLLITAHPHGFQAIVARYGFMQEPDVPSLLANALPEDLRVRASEATFFLGHETLIATKGRGMARWRKWLFSVMSRLSTPAPLYYRIPPDRVIELGAVTEL